MSRQRNSDPPDPADGHLRLAAHVDDCDACRDQPPPLDLISAALSRSQPAIDAAMLSARTLASLQPELARLASRAWWKRVAAVLLPALLPLPLVLAYDAYLLRLAYGVLTWVIPEPVATYFVFSYAALLVLIFAATYAAIPLLVAPGPSRPLATQE